MRVVSLVPSVALLGATAFAGLHTRAELAQDLDLEITNLVIDQVKTANTTLSFHLHDPDPLSNANATCNGTWVSETDGVLNVPTSDYILCDNTKSAWAFKSYSNVNDFTLNLEDRFTDESVGEPPYDRVTIFGVAVFNDTNLDCEALGDASCRTPKDKVIQVPIYATTA